MDFRSFIDPVYAFLAGLVIFGFVVGLVLGTVVF